MEFDGQHCPPTSNTMAAVTAETVEPICFVALSASAVDAVTPPRPSTLASAVASSSTFINSGTATSCNDIVHTVAPMHATEMDSSSCELFQAPTDPPASDSLLSAASATQLLDAVPSHHSVDREGEIRVAIVNKEIMEYVRMMMGDAPRPVDGSDGVNTQTDDTDAVVVTVEMAVDDIARDDKCQAALDAMEEKAQSSADESI